MIDNEAKLLKAIHEVEKKIIGLETKIDDGINGRFKDNERRINKLEDNQSKLVWAVVLAVLGAILNIVVK